MAEFSPKFKEALSLVQKPGRYTGGEPGCVYKDKSRVDVRMAFCFPDTYEIGMSFLGEKILYDILNRHENRHAGQKAPPRPPHPPRKLVV